MSLQNDIRGEIFKNLDVVINYTLTETKVAKDTNPASVGTQVAGTSRYIHNTWLNYKMDHGTLNRLGLSIGDQYQVASSLGFVYNDQATRLPDYLSLDGGVTYQKGKMTYNIIDYNILSKYLYSGGT